MNTSERAPDAKAKIVIIDDHPIVSHGIALFIEQEKDMINAGEAVDAASAMQLIERVNPDLALVDISLHGTSGIELTKSIVAAFPGTSVLIISMHDESIYLERALRAGAKGYIMKHETIEHVIAAIRKVLRGEIYVSERLKDLMVSQFLQGKTSGGAAKNKLSVREEEVLQLIGQGYTTKRIGHELYVSVKTVESHCANIKNKLGLKNLRELIQHAVKSDLAE